MKAAGIMLAGMLLSTAAAAGQVYKWVDASGHFHFSDTPQPGWTRVDAQRANVVDATVVPPSDDDAQKAAQCKQKRETLNGYRNASRIVERDALGVERVYTDEQRQQLIAKAEQEAAAACSGQDEDETEAESP